MNFTSLRMSSSRCQVRTTSQNLFKAAVLALPLTAASFLGYSLDCFANSSWNNQPSWAQQSENPDSPPPAHRVRSDARGYDSRLSPFAPGSNNLALDVGQVFLMGDLSSKYSDAIGTQLHYTYGVSDLFGFDSSLGYSSHSDGKFSMMTALAGLRTNLSWYDKVVPYMSGGLGFYKPSYQVSSSSVVTNSSLSTISPVLFGVHLGGGVDLELTRSLFFGASLTFHDMFGTTQMTPANQTLNVGGTFVSFLLHAGVTF